MKTRTTSSTLSVFLLLKTAPSIRNSLRRSSRSRRTGASLLILFALALGWSAVAPAARAVSPPPDGGYPNGNTAEGDNALFELTTGKENTAIGNQALYGIQTGSFNTAIGYITLNNAPNVDDSSTVSGNTAIGWAALNFNVGRENTATGKSAMINNLTGNFNTATGSSAMEGEWAGMTGSWNTAIGASALLNNSSGGSNTASGYLALYSNTTGSYNTAIGVEALYSNTTGIDNTASGNYSLYSNTNGFNNTADGLNALYFNTTGSNNMASGFSALASNATGLNNTALGSQALLRNTTGSSNIAMGFLAGEKLTTGSNNIDIGNAGVAGEAKTIRIGTAASQINTYIAGIYGVTASRGVGVFIDSAGHLGTTTSSARFKDAIKPMDKASEAILALEPVTFRYKHELDHEGTPQFGLVAEQVEKVNPALVVRDDQGKPYTVRYEAINAMLLNEFLKEHRKGQEQDATITELNSTVAKQEAALAQQRKDLESALAQQQKETKALSAALEEQSTQLRKVSDQLEVGKPAPRLVADHQ